MTSDDPETKRKVEEIWRHYLTTGDMPADLGAPWFMSRRLKPLIRHLPSDPRCRLCDLPFHGLGGLFTRSIGVSISTLNPNICNMCEEAIQQLNGGAEIE